MATIDNTADPTGRVISATKVNGTAVYSKTGEKLGSVEDLVIDKMSGRTEYAVLSFGGFLGIGDRHYPLPWESLAYDVTQEGYVVDVDPSRLEGAPAYATDEPPAWDAEYGQRLRDYYVGPAF